MMKKLIPKKTHLYFIILSSFFLFTLFVNMNNVNADTITINLTDTLFDKLDNIDHIISLADERYSGFYEYYIFSYDNGTNSLIYFYRYSGTSQFYTYKSNYDSLNTQSNLASWQWIECYNPSTDTIGSSCSFSTRYNFMEIQAILGGSNYSSYYSTILYSSYSPILWKQGTPQHDYIFTYNGSNFTYDPLTDPFPTLKILYDYFDNCTPTDNYPLLTSFIDVSLEKISLICDFFTSNYIFLTIFVIFIFYFVILLLRRLSS